MMSKDQFTHNAHIIAVLNEARDMWGVSIAELARRSDIDELRLGNILRGDRRLHGDELARLMVVMSVPLRTLCPARFIPKASLGKYVFGMQSGEIAKLHTDVR